MRSLWAGEPNASESSLADEAEEECVVTADGGDGAAAPAAGASTGRSWWRTRVGS